jgi:hypothetical protein
METWNGSKYWTAAWTPLTRMQFLTMNRYEFLISSLTIGFYLNLFVTQMTSCYKFIAFASVVENVRIDSGSRLCPRSFGAAVTIDAWASISRNLEVVGLFGLNLNLLPDFVMSCYACFHQILLRFGGIQAQGDRLGWSAGGLRLMSLLYSLTFAVINWNYQMGL